ncbi:hypothetical protein EDB89DRAFT_2083527 [Lactarius sanguifluus]|nr:hypothetical protein EDB89DRAFT_2083527 [Lactarius sanguifluus]
MLPDDVLLRVFDFCSMEGECAPEWWHGLAHVCRKWRQIILLSPRRLDLQLLCTCRKPVRKNLGCWPAIPIAIDEHSFDPAGQDNLFAALEKTDRVLSVSLKLTKSELEKVTLAMQRPFPALTRLRLELIPSDSTAPVILPGFLGARIHLVFAGNQFKWHILSCVTPASLRMVSCLTATTKLKDLSIEFKRATSIFLYFQKPPPPQTREILPALTRFRFLGDSNYFEDLVAQVDCPRLKSINVSYFCRFNDLIVPQLFQFIDRTEGLRQAQFRRAGVYVHDSSAHICLDDSQAEPHYRGLSLELPYRQSNWLVRLIGGLFTESPALISTVRHLSIDTLTNNQGRDNAEWLDLLRQFLSVVTLHFGGLSRIFVVPALGDLTEEMAAEVLPGLRLMNIEGWSPRYCQQLEFIAQFIARRRRSGRPVAIVKRQEDLKMLEVVSETEGSESWL